MHHAVQGVVGGDWCVFVPVCVCMRQIVNQHLAEKLSRRQKNYEFDILNTEKEFYNKAVIYMFLQQI